MRPGNHAEEAPSIRDRSAPPPPLLLQLLCKCNVTLTDKQIMKKRRGGAGRMDHRETLQLIEIRAGRKVYLMISGDGQCHRNDD